MSDESVPTVDENDLFVSSVEGHLVSRHGTGLLIGADRDPVKPTEVTWDTERVVKIPAAERASYSREYGRALRDGALKARTREEFAAMVKDHDDKVEAQIKAAAEVQAPSVPLSPTFASDSNELEAATKPDTKKAKAAKTAEPKE